MASIDLNKLIQREPPPGEVKDIIALHRSELINYGITISTLNFINKEAVLKGKPTLIARNTRVKDLTNKIKNLETSLTLTPLMSEEDKEVRFHT